MTTTSPNPFKLSSFSEEKHKYMMQFDVEQWYSVLRPYTFETHFVPLTIEEASAMAKRYKAAKVDPTIQLTAQELGAIAGAKEKLAVHINNFKANGKSSFVRISSRSPKDAGLDGSAHLKQLLNDEMTMFKQKGVPVDSNVKLQALFNASARLMEVTTADHAMHLLLNSERIYTDLCHALDKDRSIWSMKFIIREYVKLDVSYEFRGFVCNKMLTALSQYNDMCFYPQLKGRELGIVDKVFDFFGTIRDLIPYTAYVIDFVLLNDDIKVIEINPFGPVTGASLFSWTEDRYLLQGGVNLYGDLQAEILIPSEPSTNKAAKEPIVAEFTTTRAYDCGWKTLFKVYNRVPDKINSEYVNIVYGDILKSKGPEAFQKIFKHNNGDNCIIL